MTGGWHSDRVSRFRGVGIGIAVAAAVALLRRAGDLQGLVGLVTAAILILALPTSRLLSRRLLMSGLLLFGWLPLLWWWRLPVGQYGRVTILLAVLAGGLAGWTLGGDWRSRIRLIMPDWRAVDVWPFLAGASGAGLLHSWLTVKAPAGALSLLTGGWDNAAHFSMTYMIRQAGVTLDGQGLGPDGSGWPLANYPQGFHTVIATISELLYGPRSGTAPLELVRFVRAEALCFAAIMLMITGGICALPRLRRHFFLTGATVATVTIFFVIGPGAAYLINGNLNFLLSLALCIGLVQLVVVASNPTAPIVAGALAGALVGIANGWSLLVFVALASTACVLLPWRRRRLRATAQSVPWLVAIGFGVAIGVWHSAKVLLSVHSAAFASIPGFTPAAPAWRTLAISGLAIVCCLLALPRNPSKSGNDASALGRPVGRTLRLAGQASVPAMGLLIAGGLAALELHQAHHLSYYFWKVLSGLELVSIVVLAVALAHQVDRRPPRLSRRLGVTLGVAGLLALTQFFGYFLPSYVRPLRALVNAGYRVVLSPGERLLLETPSQTARPYSVASHLVQAIPVQLAHPDKVVVYLALAPKDDDNAANVIEWYRALTNTWTNGYMLAGSVPPLFISNLEVAGQVVMHLLPGHPNILVVVPPETVATLRAAVPDASVRDRIVGW